MSTLSRKKHFHFLLDTIKNTIFHCPYANSELYIKRQEIRFFRVLVKIDPLNERIAQRLD